MRFKRRSGRFGAPAVLGMFLYEEETAKQLLGTSFHSIGQKAPYHFNLNFALLSSGVLLALISCKLPSVFHRELSMIVVTTCHGFSTLCVLCFAC